MRSDTMIPFEETWKYNNMTGWNNRFIVDK